MVNSTKWSIPLDKIGLISRGNRIPVIPNPKTGHPGNWKSHQGKGDQLEHRLFRSVERFFLVYKGTLPNPQFKRS